MNNVPDIQTSLLPRANQKDNGSAQPRKSERSRERDNSVISKEARYEGKDCSQRDNYPYLSPPVKAKIIVEKAESDAPPPPPPPPRSSRPAFTLKVHTSPMSSFRKSLNPDLTTTNVVNNTASDSHNCCSVQ